MNAVAFGARALARLGYRRGLVFELSLDDGPIVGATALEADFTWLRPDELDLLARERPEATPDELAGRLERGDRCFTARVDGRVVSARWVARNSCWIDYLRTTLRVPADVVLVYDAWTASDVRGHRIASAAASRLAVALRAEGVRCQTSVIMPGNVAGIASAVRIGYVHRGTVTTLRTPRGRSVRYAGRSESYS